MGVLPHSAVGLLSVCLSVTMVTTSGDRWAWAQPDLITDGDRVASTVTDGDRVARKVITDEDVTNGAAAEPRNFIKDKLCAIGLADVSIV